MRVSSISALQRLTSLRAASPSIHTSLKTVRLRNHFPLLARPSRQRFYTMNAQELTHYLADAPPSVVRLEIEKHFEPLTDKQKRYAHFISKASFAGSRIVLRQLSPESEPIYDFIIALHKSSGGDWNSLAKKAGVDETQLTYFLEYAAQFLGNNGNYKSFGDAKFIPRAEEKTFAAFAATSPKAERFYKATNGAIYSSDKQALMHLGYPDKGHMTTYYPDSPHITQNEIEAVSTWMERKGLLPENTRLRKAKEGSFELLIASAVTSVPIEGGDIGKETEFQLEDELLKGKTIKLVYGDHAEEMKAISEYIKKAQENSSDEVQAKMHKAYAKSFSSGSLLDFKDSQRYWIRDKGPMVESNIGFIETYRDPAGIRGEWEGFASGTYHHHPFLDIILTTFERTRAFGELVSSAPKLIPLLPWSQDFEKDKFLSPDFTSLEVLTFAGSGIPAGINIPNYDDIRQTEGFKNVSLGNVLSAKAPNEKIPFISEADLELYHKYRDPAFEVQVGLHELTGHGCGKLLQETSPGTFNFDEKNPPVSPLTNKPVTTWYKPGQTWGSVFGSLAASYEECRAELVAMYLGCEFPVLKIFGFGDGTTDINNEAGNVLYAAYLQMARAGLVSLEMWDPKSQKWGQAHSQARFSILQCFLQAGDDFCKLEYKNDDLSDLEIKLDRSKILTTGRDAVAKYLQKLHVYKATADVENGTAFYKEMTNVDMDFWGTKARNVVLKNKQPRKVFVQANTFLDEASGKVSLKHYEASPVGMIQSWADREL
ncbi:putative dipeptidyl peptidase 3 [Colletotrichum tanaceti]|uniref:Dipeptidyl peptidase 3 n=1 Tax=Colletotrichum tanaceti TaxID=1306861 RepID=A0A4U6XGQ6_9PEZI|nr:putative dipeptidyl peptidase 3 [Colletotrichum tanaceti]TKW53187.1 putative dipeptidyl peptidase 3 [Colletotrichum tanaceti]